VVDESGAALPPNTPGELVVKGPGIFTGYFNAPEENVRSFDEEGFFKTGDLAKIDETGRISLTGRIREMIKRGGESISTVEIENLIISHPSVSAVAVVGMPDPVLGEKACAYIQPKPGEKVSFDGIIAFLKEKDVSVLHLPERVETVDSLPLTKAKKLDKRALEENIKRKLGIYPLRIAQK
jgi:non-ribosomal peptide synthetase component E (peptide arylation enzyme)